MPLRSTVGAAAKLRVAEARGRPVFRDWVPYDAQQMQQGSSPMRQKEEAAI
jgi:hypothetical protein